jgi:hypothetical protein
MRYLITAKNHEPGLSDYWQHDFFNPEINMIVYDLYKKKYTVDGYEWNEIIEDHL